MLRRPEELYTSSAALPKAPDMAGTPGAATRWARFWALWDHVHPATLTTANTITAFAGGGQASATALTAMINRVTVCATAGDSVRLPTTAAVGQRIYVINTTANACQVFGPTTSTINGVATATGVSLAAGAVGTFVLAATGLWHASLPPLSGVSGSIGGGALVAGGTATGTVNIAGAAVGMAVEVTPTTYPGAGVVWAGYVSSAGVVTVVVTGVIAVTPTASTYNVRVLA